MGTATPITLYNAGLFSALAYAPNGDADSEAWALTTGGTVAQDAQALQGEDWYDITGQLAQGFGLKGQYFFDVNTQTAFHVFENSMTHQIVFVFRGSTSPTTSLTNWAADLTPSDEGFSSYQGIGPKAQALYALMTTNPMYSSDTYFADGHSLGGGEAQTFAVFNSINGFAQDPLPISPGEVTRIQNQLGSTAIASYQNSYSFQAEVLQGDVANADFLGGSWAYKNVALWVNSSYEATETNLVNDLSAKKWYSSIPFSSTVIETGLLLTAIESHSLNTLNAQVGKQVAPDGVILYPGIADNPATQEAVHGQITTLVALQPIQLLLNSIEARVNNNLVAASSPSATDNASNTTPQDIAVNGSEFNTPFYLITGSSDQASALIGNPNANNLIIAGAETTQILAGNGVNYLIAGPASTTLVGGLGVDTFIDDISQVTSASTETITSPNGTGTVAVNSASAYTILSGGSPIANTLDSWQDSSGTIYSFAGAPGASTGTLTISGGVLNNGYGNEIVITDFNLSAANTSAGFLGIVLPEKLSLNSNANSGIDPPTPNFVSGSSQAYTLSINAPNASAQTITVQLSGDPASSFDAVVGTSLVPLNSNGTFNLALPAGETNVSFELVNTAGFASGDLTLSASTPNLAGLSGSSISATPLSIGYVGTSTTPTVASTLYGFNGSPGYFADYPADVTLELSHNAALQGDTVAAGSPSGDAFVWVQNANTSVVAAGNDDTILGEFGWPYGAGGTDIIVATGQHDVIENDSGLANTSGPVGIYASGFESLSTAIALSQTGTGTGLQGDLIVGSSEANTTIVGSNGNDLITNASGNDIVVAGAGNDVIIGGVKSLYDFRYWGELGDDPLLAPSAATLEDFGWRATVTNGSLDIDGGLIDVGDYPGADPDPETPSTYVAAPANYEGNYDYYGNILGLGNETIYGGSGASLILLSNGNNYVDMGTGASTVRGGMGDNTVIGGSGSQLIVGGGGSDYLTGGTGNSTIAGNGGDNTIIGGTGVVELEAGGGGADFATAETGDNYVYGGSGSGTIFGSGGMDTLIGGTGNYTIVGGAGSELITGGSGTDLLLGGVGNDTIAAGGAGNDSLQANGSASSTTYLYGGDGSDSINGGSGANIIYAGDGGVAGAATTVFASFSDATSTTTIYGGLGVDQLTGGPGTAVIYAGDGAAVAQRCTDASRRIL